MPVLSLYLSLFYFSSSVVSMSTLYVLSLRSEEDLVDVEGLVPRARWEGCGDQERGFESQKNSCCGVTERGSRESSCIKPTKRVPV